jgi:hypothetical protein
MVFFIICSIRTASSANDIRKDWGAMSHKWWTVAAAAHNVRWLISWDFMTLHQVEALGISFVTTHC